MDRQLHVARRLRDGYSAFDSNDLDHASNTINANLYKLYMVLKRYIRRVNRPIAEQSYSFFLSYTLHLSFNKKFQIGCESRFITKYEFRNIKNKNTFMISIVSISM